MTRWLNLWLAVSWLNSLFYWWSMSNSKKWFTLLQAHPALLFPIIAKWESKWKNLPERAMLKCWLWFLEMEKYLLQQTVGPAQPIKDFLQSLVTFLLKTLFTLYKEALLGFEPLHGPHDIKYLANVVLHVLDQCNCLSQVIRVTTDNTSNNNGITEDYNRRL